MTSDWIFIPQLDSIGGDLCYTGVCDLASAPAAAIAVNTLGFYKEKITFPLVASPYFTSPRDGLYIRRRVLPTEHGYTEKESIDYNKYLLK